MIDRRTEIEMRVHEMVGDLRILIDKNKLGRNELMGFLGKIRTLRVMLDNKQFGCWSGVHSSACTCTQDRTGRNVEFLKHYY